MRQPFRTVLRELGLTSHQVWGLTKSDDDWSAALEAEPAGRPPTRHECRARTVGSTSGSGWLRIARLLVLAQVVSGSAEVVGAQPFADGVASLASRSRLGRLRCHSSLARQKALVATVSCDGNGEGAGVEYAEDGVTVGHRRRCLST